MKHYNIDEFVWFVPRPKNKCAINFPRERAFNLNTALLAELGQQIDIAFHPTEPVICLRKATGDDGLKVPRSGSIKSIELNEKLLAANFKPPMRFAVTKQGNYLRADDAPADEALFIAMALLPTEVDVGTRLHYEMFCYTIID